MGHFVLGYLILSNCYNLKIKLLPYYENQWAIKRSTYKCRCNEIWWGIEKQWKWKLSVEILFKKLGHSNLFWLSCTENSYCFQMEAKVAQSLASKVEKQFGKAERKEALMQSLGELFVEKYLPKATWNPQILVRILNV